MILKPFEDFRSGFGSPSTRISIEKQRENGPNDEMPPKIITDELRRNLKSNGVSASKVNLMATPAHSGIRGICASVNFQISCLPNDYMHLFMMLQVMN